MFRIVLAVVAVLVLLVAGGLAYLAMVDMPAPTQKIEKVVPDEHFPR